MNAKTGKKLKKPLFLSRETLVDLTPALQERVRGGGDLCGTITGYRLPRPSFDPCSPILD
ncbi:MAG TPA: hypothetical protein VHU81_11180 [Thermoanaerobaculia bacterium]|jgi:hypothetical protein|nr:hypothetical protein [Thermoanaerobaculia bacterium]